MSVCIVWDDEIQTVIQIFGIPIRKRKEPAAEPASELEEALEDEMEDLTVSIQETGAPEENPTKENPAEKNPVKNNPEPPRRKKPEKPNGREKSEKPEEPSALERIFQRAGETVERLKKRFQKLADQKDKADSGDEANQKSFKLVFRQIGKLFRHLVPKKGQGKITFRFGDDPSDPQIFCRGLGLFIHYMESILRCAPILSVRYSIGQCKRPHPYWISNGICSKAAVG